MPSADNNWLGVNVGGYENVLFDNACQAMQFMPLDRSGAAQQQVMSAQQLFAEELPAVPLYYRLHLALSRPDICGIIEDGSARTMLQGLETLREAGECP